MSVRDTSATVPDAWPLGSKSSFVRASCSSAGTRDLRSVGPCVAMGVFGRAFQRSCRGVCDLRRDSTSGGSRLRNSAGFKQIIERLGILAYWRKHGFPPICRAQGGNDFTCDEVRP